MIRRRQRLSTISSDFEDLNLNVAALVDSPRQSIRGRRRSSNFDMLCDPFKYQDYVNQYLDGIEEDQEDGKPPNMRRKRTRSSTYFKQGLISH